MTAAPPPPRTRPRWVPILALLTLLTGAALPVATARGADGDVPDLLEGADVTRRLDRAEELEKSDVLGLARGLIALGTVVADRREAAMDLLVEYTIREEGRVLRMLAVDAAARLDRKAAADRYLAKADGKSTDRTTFAVQALGLTADPKDKEHVAKLMEMAEFSHETVAVEAMEALARVGAKKEADRILQIGLTHGSMHVTDHMTWTLQDLFKKKGAISKIEKAGKKLDETSSLRARAAVALLKDQLAEPHKWEDPLPKLRELVEKMPEEIEILGAVEHVEAGRATMAWLKENVPASWLLVRVAAERLEIPGKSNPDGHVDFAGHAVQVPLSTAVLPPPKSAYHVVRVACVILRERTGEPHVNHRGWEPAIFDTYDLCVVGKMYNVGPGGMTRRAFVEEILGKRPWSGL